MVQHRLGAPLRVHGEGDLQNPVLSSVSHVSNPLLEIPYIPDKAQAGSQRTERPVSGPEEDLRSSAGSVTRGEGMLEAS